jgi:dihydropteroate synthase
MVVGRGMMRLRGHGFAWGERTYLMAIVNVTPDSFSGDGRTQTESAIDYAVRQWKAGADLVDIGGESTRPGHERVDEPTEMQRVIPVIAGVRERLPDAVISIDTYKPAVARAAHAAGADIINSVWGAPEELLQVASDLDMPIAAMHNQREARYDGDVVDSVIAFLRDCAERAMLAGIGPERIMLDPGIGFGKTPNHNIRVLRGLDRICELGFPILLGTSRKSTIGKLTGREAHERIYGTAATTALGIAAGVDIVRVHDVAQNRDVISVCDAIVRDWRPSGWTG